MLVKVREDAVWVAVKRKGRFCVEAAVALSPGHLLAAIDWAQKKMVADLAKREQFFLDRGWQISDPLPHVDFSERVEADPGVEARPDPIKDQERHAAWEKAERSRVASRFRPDEPQSLVDFLVVGTFRIKAPQALRVTTAPGLAATFDTPPSMGIAGGSQLWLPR